jgi:hypothetical protein
MKKFFVLLAALFLALPAQAQYFPPGGGGGGGSGTVASGTVNQTAYYNATGSTVAGAGPGTTGQVFTSNGASSPPTFQTGGSGTFNATGAGLTSSGATVSANSGVIAGGATAVFSGGSSVVPVNQQVDVVVPYTGTISKVTMLADQSGSIVIDVWKAAYSAYPPTIGNTITASDLPTISSATKSQDSTLTGWTTSVTAGDILRFNVNSATTITKCVLVIGITKS